METAEEPTGFIKKPPSLKYLFDDKIATETEGMDDSKEKASNARKRERELHAMMDQQPRMQRYG